MKIWLNSMLKPTVSHFQLPSFLLCYSVKFKKTVFSCKNIPVAHIGAHSLYFNENYSIKVNDKKTEI